jgi:hypothetical protein
MLYDQNLKTAWTGYNRIKPTIENVRSSSWLEMSRFHFYTPPPFRRLVPLGRRNLVPILPSAPSLGGYRNKIYIKTLH